MPLSLYRHLKWTAKSLQNRYSAERAGPDQRLEGHLRCIAEYPRSHPVWRPGGSCWSQALSAAVDFPIFGVLLSEAWTRLVCMLPYSHSCRVSKDAKSSGWLLPLQLVWLSGFSRLLGGGDMVISSIVCVMIADVFSEDHR